MNGRRAAGRIVRAACFYGAACFVGAACFGLAPALAQSASEEAETWTLAVGAAKTLTLAENPSTGFQWRVDSDASRNLAAIDVSDEGYELGARDRIGAPGTHRWRIAALTPGRAHLVFAYARAWEHGPPAERHIIEIEIGSHP